MKCSATCTPISKNPAGAPRKGSESAARHNCRSTTFKNIISTCTVRRVELLASPPVTDRRTVSIPCWLAPPESDVRGRLLQDSQAQAAASSGSRWIQWAAAHARTRRPAVRRVYAPPYQQRARLANTTIDDGSAPKLSPSIEIGLLYVRVTSRVHLRAVSDATECIYGTSNKLLP